MPRKNNSTEKSQEQALDDKKNLQIVPIIIKGGSLEIDSPLVDFKDKDGKKGRKFEISVPGKIFEVSIDDGNPEGPQDFPIESENPVIVIHYRRD